MNEEAPERVRTRAAGLWSHVCGWEDLLVPLDVAPGRMTLVMGEGWTRRWSVTWRSGGGEVSCAVRDLAQMPLVDGGPTRWFSWRRGQRHRPGLQFLVSTGRHHGAESLEEARVLLALDFAGDLIDVVSQPLKLRFQTAQRHREHTPDFLAVTRSGTWLIDVRPRKLVRSEDLESFAATAEVALVCGWRYMVAAEWRTHVLTALDAFSAQRRRLGEPLVSLDTLVGTGEDP